MILCDDEPEHPRDRTVCDDATLRTVAQGAVLFQRGVPDLLGQGPNRAADQLGDGASDRKAGADPARAQGMYAVQGRFRASGAVGANR